jgi:NADPH:quinone reductase-like Zn-dependent oxidoreductase
MIMKAIQVHQTGSPDVLKYEDIKNPVPKSGQVLVKVISASVNWADVMLRKGTYPGMPSLPAIPGIDGTGIVESVGDNVTHVTPGQNVMIFSQKCYAQYTVARAASVTPIPEGIDMDEAASLPVNYLTAYHMIHTMAHVQPGQTILIYAAAGGVGTAVIQLGKLAGITVIGLTSSDEKARYTKEQGIDYIINYNTEDVLQKLREITNGKGVNVILNSVAGNTFSRDFESLAPLGQIIWFGMAAGLPQENLAEQLGAAFVKSTGIRTFVVYSILDLDPSIMAESIDTLFKYLAEKKIKPQIYDRIPLAEAARAHDILENGAVTGKLILKPW